MGSTRTAVYKSLLARLRAARQDAGLTQAQVARALKRPQSFVSKTESGERRLDPIELLEFARLYGASVGSFVAEGGTSGASHTSERPATFRVGKPRARRPPRKTR